MPGQLPIARKHKRYYDDAVENAVHRDCLNLRRVMWLITQRVAVIHVQKKRILAQPNWASRQWDLNEVRQLFDNAALPFDVWMIKGKPKIWPMWLNRSSNLTAIV